MYTEKQQAKEGSYMDETGLENYVRTITAIADDAVKKLRENPEAHDRFENAMRALLSVSLETKNAIGIRKSAPDSDSDRKILEIMAELNEYNKGCSGCRDDLISNVKNNRKSVKYALFGDFYPRGILCPSPIRDYLVYPRRSRGRFTVNPPKRRPHWIYYYDNGEKLIGVEFFGTMGKCPEPISDDIAFGDTGHTFELIRNIGDKQLGVSYYDNGIMTGASYFETKDGKPYIYCFFSQLCGRMYSCNYEKYTYTGSEITGLETLTDATTIIETNELLSSWFDRKRVERDKKGYLFFPERKWLEGYGDRS